MDTSERRTSPRAELRGDATIQLPEGGSVSGRLVDVSLGGVAILAPALPVPDGYVLVGFKLRSDASTFDVPGKVVSVRREGDATVWGIRFEDVDLGTRTRLRDYVRAYVRAA